jgi:xenotropic and polytropic retrovirus receptor 1
VALLDLQFAICYFATSRGDSAPQCSSSANGIRPLLSVLPFLWRLLQCLRRYRDTKQRFQLVNAGKYTLSIIFISVAAADGAYLRACTVART